jgi:hypothetical protein
VTRETKTVCNTTATSTRACLSVLIDRAFVGFQFCASAFQSFLVVVDSLVFILKAVRVKRTEHASGVDEGCCEGGSFLSFAVGTLDFFCLGLRLDGDGTCL